MCLFSTRDFKKAARDFEKAPPGIFRNATRDFARAPPGILQNATRDFEKHHQGSARDFIMDFVRETVAKLTESVAKLNTMTWGGVGGGREKKERDRER